MHVAFQSHHLLRLMYAAAIESAGWAPFLEGVRQALDAPVSGFSVLDQQSGQNRVWLVSGLDDSDLLAYNNHFAARNPRTGVLRRLGDGGWFRCNEHFSESFVQRDEFYQDYLRPRGLRHALAGVMVRTAGHTVHFGAWRGRGQDEFSNDGIRLMLALTPHLQNVIALALRERGRIGSAAFIDGAVTATSGSHRQGDEDLAAIVLASDCRVVSLSAGAERVMHHRQAPYRIVADRLDLLDSPRNDALRGRLSACRRLFMPRRAELESSVRELATLAHTVEGANGHLLTLKPLCPDLLGESVGALTPLAELRFDMSSLARNDLHSPTSRLSPTESAVARYLCRGASLREIAETRGVSRSTVKTQVESMMQKSGMRNQRELVAWLVSAGFHRD